MNLKRWLPFTLFFLFITCMVIFADRGKLPWLFAVASSVPLGDKVGHVFLIGTLALLFNSALSWRAINIGQLKVQLGGLIILLLITGEEISQIWVPFRTFDLGDLASNYLGIFLAEIVSRRQQLSSLEHGASRNADSLVSQ